MVGLISMDINNTNLGIYSGKNNFTKALKLKFEEERLIVEIFDNLDSSVLNKYNYLIINLLDRSDDLEKLKDVVGGLSCRIIILFPYYVERNKKKKIEEDLNKLLSLNSNLGVILVPEILGEGLSFNENFISHYIIRQSLIKKDINLPREFDLFNVISLTKLVSRVVKETFSFGIAGQFLLIGGLKKKIYIFITKYVRENSEKIIYQNDKYLCDEITPTSVINDDFSLRQAVRDTKVNFSKLFVQEKKVIDKEAEILLPIIDLPKPSKSFIKKTKLTLTNNIFKKLTLILLIIGLVVSIPLIFIFMSITSMYLSYETFKKGNEDLSYKLVKTSSFFSQTSKSISFGIPFYYNFSNILIKSSGVAKELLTFGALAKGLVSKAMGDEIYNFEYYSNEMSASLDKIYTDIGFLQSDVDGLSGYFGNLIRKKLTNSIININVFKNKIYHFKNLSSRISNLLGLEKPKKYLILFQNNMELRPTGGFIGSFAIISIDKGRLSEIVVNDIYSADGQLKGHVDPPEPILKYLGEGGWYMRDSNWDPDFPTTASKVEWFLDKEMDSQIDGVIAIDLYFIQSLLKITGPINLVDFNKIIDDKNLYQTTQSEVESEFFPGSIKKASFLTSLSKNLITEVEHLPSSKYFLFFKEIYKNLEERHIQIFLHDPNSQNAVSELGFSGEIDTNTDCGLNCIIDNYSLIDANLGVNKANYFIERSQEVDLIVNKENINHELIINYKNNASIVVGAQGLYKNYTRLILPRGASNISVNVIIPNGDYANLEFDTFEINNRKEIGFLMEVLPGSSQKIQVVWDLPNDKLKQGGEFRLLIRKQAGTDNDGLNVNIVSKDLSLTGKTLPVYNTTLARDFSARLFFK